MDERCSNKSNLTTVNHSISSFTRCIAFIKGPNKKEHLIKYFNGSRTFQQLFFCCRFGFKMPDLLMGFTQQTPNSVSIHLNFQRFPPSPSNHLQSLASPIHSNEYFIKMQRFPPSQCVIKCTQCCRDLKKRYKVTS